MGRDGAAVRDAAERARLEWVSYYLRTGQLEMASRLGFNHDRMARRLQIYARSFLQRRRERLAGRSSPAQRRTASVSRAVMPRGSSASAVSRPGRLPPRAPAANGVGGHRAVASRAAAASVGARPSAAFTPHAAATPADGAEFSRQLLKKGFLDLLYTPGALAPPKSASRQSSPRTSLAGSEARHGSSTQHAGQAQPFGCGFFGASASSTASTPRERARERASERAKLLGPLPEGGGHGSARSGGTDQARSPAGGYDILGSPPSGRGGASASPQPPRSAAPARGGTPEELSGYERPKRFEASVSSAGSLSFGRAAACRSASPRTPPPPAGAAEARASDGREAARERERAHELARLREWEAEAAAEAEVAAEARAKGVVTAGARERERVLAARLRSAERALEAERERSARLAAHSSRLSPGSARGGRREEEQGEGDEEAGAARDRELERSWRRATRPDGSPTHGCRTPPPAAPQRRAPPQEARFALAPSPPPSREKARVEMREGGAEWPPQEALRSAARNAARRPQPQPQQQADRGGGGSSRSSDRAGAPPLGPSHSVISRFAARAALGQQKATRTPPAQEAQNSSAAAARTGGVRAVRRGSSPSRLLPARPFEARKPAALAAGANSHVGVPRSPPRGGASVLTAARAGALPDKPTSSYSQRRELGSGPGGAVSGASTALRRAASFDRARRPTSAGGAGAAMSPRTGSAPVAGGLQRSASAERLAPPRAEVSSPPRRQRPLDELTAGGSPKGPVQRHELARQSRTALRKETSAFLERLARHIVSADAARIAAERTRASLLAAARSASAASEAAERRLRELAADSEAARPDSAARALALALGKEASVARRADAELRGAESELSDQVELLGLAIVDMRHDCANKAHLQEHLLGSAPLSALRLPYPSSEQPFPLSAGVKSSDDLLALATRLTDGTRALTKRAAGQQRGALNDIKNEQWAVSQARGVPRAVRPPVMNR